ncbi:MAG TPA: 50S ribosomal protein L30 [Myxococcota bacterium]|jgi:large subunit ribosomal protein L30|nr:50S ribosomal protein L30 [Myxococcota bacterium]
MANLKVTLLRSTIGCAERVRATVRGLGLRKVGSSRELENTPAVRGMIKSVLHLVQVEENIQS